MTHAMIHILTHIHVEEEIEFSLFQKIKGETIEWMMCRMGVCRF